MSLKTFRHVEKTERGDVVETETSPATFGGSSQQPPRDTGSGSANPSPRVLTAPPVRAALRSPHPARSALDGAAQPSRDAAAGSRGARSAPARRRWASPSRLPPGLRPVLSGAPAPGPAGLACTGLHVPHRRFPGAFSNLKCNTPPGLLDQWTVA